MAIAATLEHPVARESNGAAPARAFRQMAKLQSQLSAAPLHGWRFPAEFRLRPTGWIERGAAQQARQVAPPDHGSTHGNDGQTPLVLDPGPAGCAIPRGSADAAAVSNGQGATSAVLLAYGSVPASREASPPSPPCAGELPMHLDYGFTTSRRFAPDLGECVPGCSNSGVSAASREIGALPLLRQLAARPEPFCALAVGTGAGGPVPLRAVSSYETSHL